MRPIETIKTGIKAFLEYKKLKQLKKHKRRFWVHDMFLSRDQTGFFVAVYPKIKNDLEKFLLYTRMTVPTFHLLLSLLKGRLEKSSIRKLILPECRLLITIMYRCSWWIQVVILLLFQIGLTTLRTIIFETDKIIWDELSTVYLPFPTVHDYLSISEKYYRKNKIPHFCGAIDGKHIKIVCPPNSGSSYYNYKGTFSTVLAVCDADHLFTTVDIGSYGSESDGSIFRKGEFGRMLLQRRLPIPDDNIIPNTDTIMPYYFISDNAFPLNKNLMRPFPERDLSQQKENFNQMISSARMSIENTFGIMTSRWRIVLNNIYASPDNVDTIVKAIVVLHNFLKLNSLAYCPPEYVDRYIDEEFIPGQWRINTVACYRFD